jgi:hypothetical protein
MTAPESEQDEPTVFVIFTSHRSREKGLRAIGEPKPQAYWSMRRNLEKGVYLLNGEQIGKLNGLKGWRRLRGPYEDLMKCWS